MKKLCLILSMIMLTLTAPSASAAPAESASDLESQLRALKSLLDDGILTQEEFDAKKKQVLGL